VEVLAEDLTIAGAVHVTLHVQSTCRDTETATEVTTMFEDGREIASLVTKPVVQAFGSKMGQRG
jgi:predicted acyl esterase